LVPASFACPTLGLDVGEDGGVEWMCGSSVHGYDGDDRQGLAGRPYALGGVLRAMVAHPRAVCGFTSMRAIGVVGAWVDHGDTVIVESADALVQDDPLYWIS